MTELVKRIMKLRIVLIGFVLSFICTNVVIGLPKGNREKKEVGEFKERGNLPNFFSKVRTGDSIKVAYLRGSITTQNECRILNRFIDLSNHNLEIT